MLHRQQQVRKQKHRVEILCAESWWWKEDVRVCSLALREKLHKRMGETEQAKETVKVLLNHN